MRDNRNKLILGAAAFHGFRLFKRRQKHLSAAFHAVLLVLIFLTSMLIQVIGPASNAKLYALTPDMYKLAGSSRGDASRYLKLDEKTGNYTFEVPQETDSPDKQQVGFKADSYSATFAKDAKGGITFNDTATKIALKFVPKFYTLDGQKVEGEHIVYPAGADKLTYTLKNNGLKEDIIVPSYRSDSLAHDFELVLPSGVEARLDAQGNIGIYSADTTLYGNITFGSDKDRELIDKARENGQKTHLVATIPAPIVKDAAGKEYTDKAEFKLSDKSTRVGTVSNDNQNLPPEVKEQISAKATQNVYQLGIHSKQLKDLAYPISIDPTIQSSAASDFDSGNIEGVEIDRTNNTIKRPALTGGTLGAWAVQPSGTDIPAYFGDSQNITYTIFNNYMYIVASGTGYNGVSYAKLDPVTGALSGNTCGTSITWCVTVAPANNHVFTHLTAHNGYIYLVAGGWAQFIQNGVSYAKIQPDGSLVNPVDGSPTTWQTESGNLITGRFRGGVLAYNGWLYVSGGCTSENGLNHNCNGWASNVEKAQINGDGTLGAWASAGSYSGGRSTHAMDAYNGYLYVSAGCQCKNPGLLGGTDVWYFDIQYASIDSNGSLGTFVTNSTDINGAGTNPIAAVTIQKGYMYRANDVGGGAAGYAPIHPNGSIGQYNTTNAYTELAGGNALLHNGNHLYALGTPSINSHIQMTTINPIAGTPSGWTNTNAVTTARNYSATAVFNGYVYLVSGCTASDASKENCGATATTIEYGTINATTGAITWNGNTTTGVGTGLWGHRAYADNGRLYITGGCTRDIPLGNCTISGNTLDIALNATTGNTTGSFTTRSSVITARMLHGFTVYNGYAYVLGGWDGSAAMSSVQYKALATDGSIPTGTWSTGTALPQERYFIDAVVYSGKLYTAGGRTTSDTSDTIIYISINSDGSLAGTWTTNSITMAGTPWDKSIIVNKGYLYLLSRNSDVIHEFGLIQSDGSVINPTGSGSSLSSFEGNTTNHGLGDNFVAAYDYIYGISGCQSTSGSGNMTCTGSPITTTQYIPINNGGSGILGSWQTTTVSTINRQSATSIITHGRIYIMGGCTDNGCTTLTPNVQFATLNANGTVGAWSTGTSLNLPNSRGNHSTVLLNDYVYVIGGFNGSRLGSVLYAKINSDGTLSTNSCGTSVIWCTTSAALPTPCHLHSSVTYDGYIYVLGGSCDANTGVKVRYTTPSSAGDITSWGTTLDLPDTRVWMNKNTVAVNGYIYVVGGCTVASCTSDSHYLNTVLMGQINLLNGTISSWGYTTTASKPGRRSHSVSMMNGYLYSIGGDGGPSSGWVNTSVEYVPILASGQLGQWQTTTSLPATVNSAAIASANGYIYLLGGSGPTNTTRYVSPQSIPRIATFSKLFDFGSGVRPNKIVTRGTKYTNATMGLNYKVPAYSSATFTAAVDNNITSTAHGLLYGQAITVSSGGTLPGGLTAGTKYYVLSPTTNVFQLSTTYGGTAVDITSVGSGTHTYKTADNFVFGTPAANSNIGLGGGSALSLILASNTTLARYLFVSYSIDDTYSAVFPDDTRQSNIEGFDIYFAPNPVNRLRGGRSFTNGQDRGIQVSP